MTGFLLSTYHFFSFRKGLLYLLLFSLLLVFAFFAFRIKYKEDIAQFLPSGKNNEKIHETYKYVTSSNRVIIYVKSPERDENAAQREIAATDALAERLAAHPDATKIKSITCRVDMEEIMSVSSFVAENMPYFLDGEDYAVMDTLLSQRGIAERLQAARGILTSSAGMIMRQNILSDPLQMTAGVMKRLQNLRAEEGFFLYQDHIFTEDSTALLFLESEIPSSETSENRLFFDSLHQIMAEVEREFPDVNIESFGTSEIALTNARRIRKDTLLSVALATFIILGFLIYSFRSARKIALVFASVLFGGLFATAAMSCILGEVSVIATGISSIMAGIAINYPLHYIEHFNHTGDHKLAIKEIVRPLTTGNVTTVSAFVSLAFMGSEAMRDLGLFAAFLLAGAIIFVLIFLPHFLPSAHVMHPSKASIRESFFSRPPIKNSRLVAAVITLTVLFALTDGDSHFETNMQNINYMTPMQKKSYEKMNALLNDKRHVIYFVSTGENEEAALEVNERNMPVLKALLDDKTVYKIVGPGGFLPSQNRQKERIEKWNSFWNGRRDSVMTILSRETAKAGFRADAFKNFEEMLYTPPQTVDISRFEPIRKMLAGNHILEGNGRTMIVNLLYTDKTKAESIENRLNSIGDATSAFDAGSITKRMITSLSDNFNYVLFTCGLIVFIFLFISFGRIELAVITFLPLALSWIWILGIMNLFDIKFNIVNIILATFIFGQGDDYTIFMTEGLMYEHACGRKILPSYRKSIAMSAFIMLSGMGMLIFARHPALRSLAQVTIIGMVTVLIMSYAVPSLLFEFLTLKKGKRRPMPLTLTRLAAMACSFTVFLIMSLALTVAGRVLFAFGRKTERKKLIYHRILHRVACFVVHHIPLVKTSLQNERHETFDKPAVIICNHQSHLDLICIMMLTPKLIILTNDWVWNSPFYGKLIKYAGFYPVSNGIENAADKLKADVENGYSIVIFPEGTRSADCSIRRFHKGAFYLAEQLKLDIIPVLLHGAGHVLPKNDFMLRKGSIHMRILPRITSYEKRFRQDYAHRSIDVRHYCMDMYKEMSARLETPDYYADLVKHNYIYKGAEIERAVKRRLRKNNNFKDMILSQPEEGKTEIENSGYGEYPLLLSLVKKQLQITVTEPDMNIRRIAENCVSIPENLKYEKEISN
ncbi:MAG: 1-acyl-sn-glycerol-3-phosphate acyltransferase [Tannerella sp.]|nr:1-acyl-sn-glycerol-3-phosphate acyltransferase [Tannerella sp.]